MSDPEDVERLRAQVETLSTQVRRLIRTEMSLHRASIALEAQIKRIERLNRFALSAVVDRDPASILKDALELLVQVCTFDQAAAYFTMDGGVAKPIAVFTVDGREFGSQKRMTLESMGLPLAREDLPGQPWRWDPARARDEPHWRIVEASDRLFANADKPDSVPDGYVVPVVAEGAGYGALVLRCSRKRSALALSLPEGTDLPYLELVARHVERALEGARFRTERTAMLAQLVQAERLASVGVLAAGVAHEINNPLTYVMMSLEKLAKGATADARSATLVEAALDGSRRIRGIVRDLKTFSRVDEESRAVVHVEHVLDTVVAMAAAELRYRARVTLSFVGGATTVGNEGRLAQVFLNLVINAAHAMPDEATEQNEIVLATSIVGDDVVVEVRDNGVGIAEADLARVFEPFFSTKPIGAGSGLGLSICKNIVEAHGGRIEVESMPGQGTTFRVHLPRARASAFAGDGTGERGTDPGRARDLRVLVVDDESSLRSLVVATLGDVHRVDAARDGREAVERLVRGSYDVILCDLMMPEMTGVEVHAWICENRPDLRTRIVFMTGGALTESTRRFVEAESHVVLEKPFADTDLFAVIDAAARRANDADQDKPRSEQSAE